MAHDLIFFTKRSTPKVVAKGAKFTAPDSYGPQTRRRPATEDEEKIIARGDWLRVDQSGNKGGQDGYKKTRMKGREHLVQSEIATEDFLSHYGIKGMKWGVRNATLNGLHKSGFAAAAKRNAENSDRRTAAGVKVGSSIGRGTVAKKLYDRSHKPDISGVSRSAARKSIKKSNVETNRRLEDFEASPTRSNQIRTARTQKTKAIREFQDAKTTIKEQKATGDLGKNAARVMLNEAGNKRYETVYKADSTTAGEAFMNQIMGGLYSPSTSR